MGSELYFYLEGDLNRSCHDAVLTWNRHPQANQRDTVGIQNSGSRFLGLGLGCRAQDLGSKVQLRLWGFRVWGLDFCMTLQGGGLWF